MTKTEIAVLGVLKENTNRVYTFACLSERLLISRVAVKRACRGLARKKKARHSIAWDEDDGGVKGSGYVAEEL